MAQAQYPMPAALKKEARLDAAKYQDMYTKSINDPEAFWAEHGKRISWFTPYTKVKNTHFGKDDVTIEWFRDGTLNACYNCVDRHLPERADKTAIVWEGDDVDEQKHITFRELHEQVAKLANGLKKLGVKKGDRVAIYMPMVPEAAFAMLACARIGAVHSVIFAGFSPHAIADRVNDCEAKVIITANEGRRGSKGVALKANVDKAVADNACPSVTNVLVFKHTDTDVAWNQGLDVWWHELLGDCDSDCPAEVMQAEDPLFILYTSGSTGKPKGVQHTTGGYMVYASMTHEYVFDLREDDVYWCAADVGWITGHSYIVYGPLANGTTTLMFEGVPTYPDETRIAKIVDKHQVTILYTAPTAIRALMAKGDAAARGTKRDSLRILGSVGEPINPEAWDWYFNRIGNGNCPIMDTFWQTETGGIMITPLPAVKDMKPGSAMTPFFGVKPGLVDNEGKALQGAAEGNLVIADSWPGQSRTLWGDHERFIQTYFSTYPGYYFTGDGAKVDADGDYTITGRVDDVLNVSGHRLGTAEIESALVAHEAVAEAAVVGFPHDIKGQGIYVYVTVVEGTEASDDLRKELIKWVRTDLSPIATPDFIQFAPGLPKTRSGKIMRRILRKIAANEFESLGDTSTLADPSVVDSLIDNRLNK
ncbi:acetate--CoA ligase [Aliidiomarina maris]|uniref:Acetyl-coenzyme A synthetase n=1 Tax=Aliidiomarina maris TaxID=531312 RepID=A0A327X3I9_9GAMM|nr:acetate--CoA ligase [Aliidiomarina maris]MCL5050913.1 acetate--CoA ligase [Bacillota bacterium]RAK00700.1 acetyl-coenzyme A synthetase [Aliidiomarina maris]RUO27299.1 acetate--CoA ligase [Aliidiomarina maris]